MTKMEVYAEHAREGMLPGQIAAKYGVTPTTVSAALCKARERGIDAPKFKKGARALKAGIPVYVSPQTRRLLQMRAYSRQQDPAELVEIVMRRALSSDRIVTALIEGGAA